MNAKSVFGTTGNRYGGSPALLLYSLRGIMVRHTKAQHLGGAPTLALPPKTERTVTIEFTAAERAAYAQVHAQAKKQYDQVCICSPPTFSIATSHSRMHARTAAH